MQEIHEATVKINEKDIFNFMATHSLTKRGDLISFLFGVTALLVLPFFAVLENWFAVVLLFGVGTGFVVATPAGMYMNARKQAKINPVFKKPITFRLDREGMAVHQYTGELQLEWKKILRVLENKTCFFFYVNGEQALILPKRAFEDKEGLDAFRNLVEESVDGRYQAYFLEGQEKPLWNTIRTILGKPKSSHKP
ncbi:YcxB family protein [Anaerotalea alkaliphila]|uniref:YcxB family protein n=1 Tax=Anaerotalea alkaliphila TaxID=2662126 RepID=A0A7X5HVX8_9FIRM|nr:YcxB family protein [Anaerotalea alkaliphila]NDL67635.1 YcxB family protein [Anaerotalea alkaliphila]